MSVHVGQHSTAKSGYRSFLLCPRHTEHGNPVQSLTPPTKPFSFVDHQSRPILHKTHTHTHTLQWTMKKEDNAEERRRCNSSTSRQCFFFPSLLSLCFFLFPSLSLCLFCFRLANTHRFLFAASFQPRLERMHRYHTTLRRSKKTPLRCRIAPSFTPIAPPDRTHSRSRLE